jgi:hypothetical protein
LNVLADHRLDGAAFLLIALSLNSFDPTRFTPYDINTARDNSRGWFKEER